MKPGRREIEAKYKLNSDREVESAVSRLLDFGFVAKTPRTELDYALDTPEWSCRTNGLILRFRRVSEDGSVPYIMLTLKEKRQHETYLDHNETELILGTEDAKTWEYIQAVLTRVIKLKLPENIRNQTDFVEIIKSARAAGFSRHRILLEKRRREFTHAGSRVNVTIDTLPDGMGTYMEVEAYSPEALETTARQLKLTDFEDEPLDYGEILKRHKQTEESEIAQRTAVFDIEVRKLIADKA